MDDHTPAEALPTLYRAVLDIVMRLEHVGDRAFAYRIRQDALRTYSTRWDDHGRVALRKLERRAHERLANLPGVDGCPSLVASIESV